MGAADVHPDRSLTAQQERGQRHLAPYDVDVEPVLAHV